MSEIENIIENIETSATEIFCDNCGKTCNLMNGEYKQRTIFYCSKECLQELVGMD